MLTSGACGEGGAGGVEVGVGGGVESGGGGGVEGVQRAMGERTAPDERRWR